MSRAALGIDEYLYKKSKKKEASDYYNEVRAAIKFNNADLVLKLKKCKTYYRKLSNIS